MPGYYHTRVQNIIGEIGNEYAKIFKRVFIGNRKIQINHISKTLSIAFIPDAIIETKTGHQHIFQILDTQIDDQSKIESDIIEAYISPSVTKMYFIAKTQKELDSVNKIADVMMSNLIDVAKKPYIRNIQIVYLLISEEIQDHEIKNILLDAIIGKKIEKVVIQSGGIVIDTSFYQNALKQAEIAKRTAESIIPMKTIKAISEKLDNISIFGEYKKKKKS